MDTEKAKEGVDICGGCDIIDGGCSGAKLCASETSDNWWELADGGGFPIMESGIDCPTFLGVDVSNGVDDTVIVEGRVVSGVMVVDSIERFPVFTAVDEPGEISAETWERLRGER